MSFDPAIRVRDLSKCYEIYARPQDRLKQSIHPRLQRWIGTIPKNYYREFWALKDVSFEVVKGEAVGILGRNGAGKSTLLQLICGTLNPTSGSVQVEGTVGALLELGSGFNPEFTGRENVYLNASMLGLTQREIDDKFDEIGAFADIGEYLEQPTKTYSSGMLMRLAFAVNTCINPEILIVDEALGVGDAPFQSKCFKRLRQLINDGTSILFVSHDLSTVRSICSRALWLKNGHAEVWGPAKQVAKDYEKFCWREQGVVLDNEITTNNSNVTSATLPGIAETESPRDTNIDMALRGSVPDGSGDQRYGTRQLFIRQIAMLDCKQRLRQTFDYDEEVSLVFHLEARTDFQGAVRIGTRVKSIKQDYVLSVSDLESSLPLDMRCGEHVSVYYTFSLPLTHGYYSLLVALFEVKPNSDYNSAEYDFSNSVVFDCIDNVCPFSIRPHLPISAVGPVHMDRKLQLR